MDRPSPLETIALFAGYIAVLGLGVIVRAITLEQFTGHIDEPASLLAIARVADAGYPSFPSGVIYLQGALFSYVAAPLTWFFDGDGLLHAARLLHLCLTLALIPLSMKLAHYVTGNAFIAIFVGILVSCDPNLIIWSVAIRPYGMLAVEIVALLLLFTVLLKEGPDARLVWGRVVYWIPVVAATGTFTHIGFWLTFPVIAFVAMIVWKHSLLGSHRAILFSGALSILPLFAFLLLGRFVGTGSGTGGGKLGSLFVGSHLFSVDRFLDFTDVRWVLWTHNFFEGSFYELMPYLITLASGVLVGAVVAAPHENSDRWRLPAIGTLVLVHWVCIGVVGFVVFANSEPPYPHRYLNQVLPLGYILLGLAVWRLWLTASHRDAVAGLMVKVGIVTVILAPALVYIATAASWRMEYPGGSADYWEATKWTAEHMEAGQVAITALPPSAYFWFSEQQMNRLFFLAGSADSRRTQRYIKPNTLGEPGDYWLGIGPIGSTEQLCETLRAHAGNAWIIVDAGRLNASWALRGPLQTIITGSSVVHYRGHKGVMARLASPVDTWTPEARAACGA